MINVQQADELLRRAAEGEHLTETEQQDLLDFSTHVMVELSLVLNSLVDIYAEVAESVGNAFLQLSKGLQKAVIQSQALAASKRSETPSEIADEDSSHESIESRA